MFSAHQGEPNRPNLRLSAFALFACLLLASPASAATIEVDISDEEGAGCSLRSAVMSINESSAANGCSVTGDPYGVNDTIHFSPSVSGSGVVVREIPIQVLKSIRIDGEGEGTVISGANETLIFSCSGASLFELQDVAVIEGQNAGDGAAIWLSSCPLQLINVTLNNNVSGGDGAAIFAEFSSIDIRESNISLNTAGDNGAAIYSQPASSVQITDSVISENSSGENVIWVNGYGPLVIDGSQIVNNDATAIKSLNVDISINQSLIQGSEDSWSGGAIYTYTGSNDTPVNIDITKSTFSENSAGYYGGAIYTATRAIIDIQESTFSSNSAGRYGGAIYVSDASSLSVRNSTFSSNSVQSSVLPGGGAIHAVSLLTEIDLTHVTLFKNSAPAGGAIYLDDMAEAQIYNSIVSDTQGAADCVSQGGLVVADEYSLISLDDCSTSASNLIPQLEPLEDNGGVTRTHAIEPFSPGWKDGNATHCLDFDQRGVQRSSGTCDVGSFEEVDFIFRDRFSASK